QSLTVEGEDHGTANQYTHDRYKGNPGSAERTLGIGIAFAHQPNTGTNQYEGEERTEAGEVTGNVSGNKSSEQSHEYKEDPVGFVGSFIFRVEGTKGFGDQTIVTHGVEDPALAHQHHQDYRRETSQNSDGYRRGQPFISVH